MEIFCAARGYPHDLITRERLRAEEKQRADVLVTTPGSNCTAADRLSLRQHPVFSAQVSSFFLGG